MRGRPRPRLIGPGAGGSSRSTVSKVVDVPLGPAALLKPGDWPSITPSNKEELLSEILESEAGEHERAGSAIGTPSVFPPGGLACISAVVYSPKYGSWDQPWVWLLLNDTSGRHERRELASILSTGGVFNSSSCGSIAAGWVKESRGSYDCALMKQFKSLTSWWL